MASKLMAISNQVTGIGPGGINRDLKVFVPLADGREAHVSVSIVETDDMDPLAPATVREPTVPELDMISQAMFMRAYNSDPTE